MTGIRVEWKELPPLPPSAHQCRGGLGEYVINGFHYYTADQMHAYARAAIAGHEARKWQAEPVEYEHGQSIDGPSDMYSSTPAKTGNHPKRISFYQWWKESSFKDGPTDNGKWTVKLISLCAFRAAHEASRVHSPAAEDDKRDAERYRWLRREINGDAAAQVRVLFALDAPGEDAMDAEIDAAMQSIKSKE